MLEHVTATQLFYLGCVHSVVREWLVRGRPRSKGVAHDFRKWAEPMDWIVRELFGSAPLMEWHRKVQARVGNPALSWARQVALVVAAAGRKGEHLSASAIFELCQDHPDEVAMQSGKRELETKDGARHVGVLLKQAFQGAQHDVLTVDDLRIERLETKVYNAERKENEPQKRYVVEDADAASF